MEEINPRDRIVFWVFASIGVLVMSVAWTYYGMAQQEAESDQGKALSANTTMEGTGELMGGVPLLIVHALGLVILLRLGWLGWRRWGLLFGLTAVLIASVIGVVVAQILFGGELFEIGVGRYYREIP
ncbi:hypothetical protein G7068_09290 [Leucobacter viscericola]|uniref:Uncharacterized protein n=1 Tax=Leucobacter viscericola TaxID=2714935 RepID=A0A6G7XG02_9MICO|nr:hypothetical protein [Leucobacter viscericola]QIK63369.1 hypothetical protein G7068_09290 [Leucobacter viscericola]